MVLESGCQKQCLLKQTRAFIVTCEHLRMPVGWVCPVQWKLIARRLDWLPAQTC